MHRGRAFILLGDLCLRHCVFVALCFCFCHAFLLPVNVRNPSLGARLMQCTSSPRVLYEETLFSPSTTIFGDWNSERTIRILFLVTWNLVRSSFQLLLFPFLFSFLLTFFFFFVTLSTMRGKKRWWCFHRLSSIESIVVSRPCFQGITQSRTFAHNHGTDLSSAILGDFHRNAAHELNTNRETQRIVRRVQRLRRWLNQCIERARKALPARNWTLFTVSWLSGLSKARV